MYRDAYCHQLLEVLVCSYATHLVCVIVPLRVHVDVDVWGRRCIVPEREGASAGDQRKSKKTKAEMSVREGFVISWFIADT